MKKTARRPRIKPGPLILFLIFCIVGGLAGIAINNHYYTMQRGGIGASPATPTR